MASTFGSLLLVTLRFPARIVSELPSSSCILLDVLKMARSDKTKTFLTWLAEIICSMDLVSLSLLFLFLVGFTLLETNIAPETLGLEDEIPFGFRPPARCFWLGLYTCKEIFTCKMTWYCSMSCIGMSNPSQ